MREGAVDTAAGAAEVQRSRPKRTRPANQADAIMRYQPKQRKRTPQIISVVQAISSVLSNLLACLGHNGRIRVVLGHTLKTLRPIITQKQSHNVLSKFMILCWAAFTAILGRMRPRGRRLDTPGGICYSLCWF